VTQLPPQGRPQHKRKSTQETATIFSSFEVNLPSAAVYATSTGRQAGAVRLSSGMASVATDLALCCQSQRSSQLCCACADRFDAEDEEDDDGDDSEEPKAKSKPRTKKSKTGGDGEEKEKKPRAPGKPVR